MEKEDRQRGEREAVGRDTQTLTKEKRKNKTTLQQEKEMGM